MWLLKRKIVNVASESLIEEKLWYYTMKVNVKGKQWWSALFSAFVNTMCRAATHWYLNSRELKAKCSFVLAATTAATSQFIIPFIEAVTNREEVPASLSIYVTHTGLLPCVLCTEPVTKSQFRVSTSMSFVIRDACSSVTQHIFTLY